MHSLLCGSKFKWACDDTKLSEDDERKMKNKQIHYIPQVNALRAEMMRKQKPLPKFHEYCSFTFWYYVEQLK